jgi:L-threonylcarbamoyladenylate synthase
MKILQANTENINRAAKVIINGGIVIYPTDTVYGLGGLPSHPKATERICDIKGRAKKPLPLICSENAKAENIVVFNE